MSVHKERKIVFDMVDGVLTPSFTCALQPRSIEIRNRKDFEDQFADGVCFAVRIVTMEGNARRPHKIIVDIVRRIVEVGDSPLGDKFWIDPMVFALIEADLNDGAHIRLVGPRGTGKTVLVKLLAEHYGVKYIKVDGAAIINARSAFGSDSAKSGSAVFKKSRMVEFMESFEDTDGDDLRGIIHVDEFSRMNASGEGPWHPLLDGTGTFDLQTSDGPLTVKVPRGVVFVLTDNEQGGGHVGVMPMDIALQDRLERFELGYPKPEWEIPWLVRQTGIEKRDAEAIVEVANRIRQLATDQGFDKGGPSPRRTLRAASYVKRGIARDIAIRHAIINFYTGDREGDDRAMVIEHLRHKNLLHDAV